MRIMLLALLLLMIFVAAPSRAEDKDWNDCVQAIFGKTEWDRQILGCSRIIARGGKESQEARSSAYVNRSIAYREKGDYDRSISDINEAIRIGPNDISNIAQRGEAYYENSDYQNAIHDLTEVIRIKPRAVRTFYVRALYIRGRSYEKIGDLQRALSDFKTALSLRPTSEEFRDKIAAIESALAAQSAPSNLSIQSVAISSETRVGLIIGNARYAAQSPLVNPKNDAAAVAEALRQAGFTKVVLVEDLSRKALVDALQAFQSEADRADWAVIYFSGHGVEIGGENYLVPVDAQLASDRNASDEAVSLSRVIDSVHGARKLRMVILDACRNNPFLAGMRRSLAFKSGGKGLAPPSPPPGTLVFYAAKEGEQAQDGKGRNSPFAAALAKSLSERGLELFKMLRYVTVDVQEATRDGQGRPTQHPTFYGDLASRDDFYFRP